MDRNALTMDHSVIHSHLISIITTTLLFFAVSGVIIPLLQRFRISPVLGYLMCGIMIGPMGVGQFSEVYPWVSYISIDDLGTVHILGELGIISLMFMIGLELSFGRLKELRRFIFGLGSAQILTTGAIIFGIALLFDNTLQTSILLGASFALSSTAIVMKLLDEHKLSNRPIGVLCFSILLMQDLAVVPILVMTSSFASDTNTSIMVALGTSVAAGVITVTVIYLFGKKVLTPLLKSISFSTTPEWLIAFIIFTVLGCALITDIAGLSLALGAFIAGLLIGETEFKHEVEVIISPLKGLLLGIFFLSIGMMVNIADVISKPGLLLLSVLGIFLLKGCILFALCMAFRVPGRQAVEASVYLAQPGEFALMILGVAMSTQLMPAQDVQFFLLVTVLAMMLTPLLFKVAPIAGKYGHKLSQHEPDISSPTMDREARVVIAGFGNVGQVIARALEAQHIPYIAFDNDGQRVQELRQKNFQVIYGNACKKRLWTHVVGESIEIAIIAIDDHNAARSIIHALRTQFPLLHVIARSKKRDSVTLLYDAGADTVIIDTVESGLRMTHLLMERLRAEIQDVDGTVNKIRANTV